MGDVGVGESGSVPATPSTDSRARKKESTHGNSSDGVRESRRIYINIYKS